MSVTAKQLKQLKTKVKQLKKKNRELKSEKNELISGCLARQSEWKEMDYDSYIEHEKAEKVTAKEVLETLKGNEYKVLERKE
jgi:hypothetical protein